MSDFKETTGDLQKSNIDSHLQSRLDPTKRVFVNRTLNFANIKLIGFDMDHTLALYYQNTFEALAFGETLKKFVAAGYPAELLSLEYKNNYVIRGLLVDRERGNILKVDTHKYVKDAYHGHRRLSKEERYNLYNAYGINPEKFLTIDTIFALSEVQLFTEIVHFMSQNPGRIKKPYKEVYSDIRKYIDMSHRDGTIKREVIKNPERYIKKDKYLASTLVRLIDAGKTLFLLTNSQYDYTDAMLSFLLNNAYEGFSRWKDFFGYAVVGSGKPGFFVGDQPFFEIVEESNLLKQFSGAFLEAGKVYYGGNARLFEELTGYRGDEILYIGDHIYGDIIRSKDRLNWRTLLVIEELEEELPKLTKARKQLEAIFWSLQEKEAIDERLQKIRSKIAANRRQVTRAKLDGDQKKILRLGSDNEQLGDKLELQKVELKKIDRKIKSLIAEREACIHPLWGEMMKVGLERSRFANQVNAYACMYTSRVSNLRFYSPFKKFISFHEVLPHEV